MAVLLLCAPARGLESLPGDADCDGLVLETDVDRVQAELTDGDDATVAALEEGEVSSCTGADANQDGLVSVADLTATLARFRGTALPNADVGPVITFFGVTGADGTSTTPIPGGHVPIYQRRGGLGFNLVIEVARGLADLPIGQQLFLYDPDDPTVQPDLQIIFTQPLLQGTAEVCDEGGVPRIFPPNFATTHEVAAAMNDASCRFSVVSNPSVGCTVDAFGTHHFVNPQTRTQFCVQVSGSETFISGTTLVTARVLDAEGNPGPAQQIIVFVGSGPPPTPVPSPTPTNTWPPSPTRTPTDVITRVPTSTPTRGPVTGSPTPTSRATATPTRTRRDTPGSPTRTATRTPTAPTGTATRRPTLTRTPTNTRRSSPTRTGMPTPTNTRRGTLTPTGTVSRVPTATRTSTGVRPGTRTSTPTRTPSVSRTPTATRSMGPTMRAGPDVSFFGITRPDDRVVTPTTIEGGIPVFVRQSGHAFNLVIEGKPGPSRRPVGRNTFSYDPGNPDVLPDLQLIVLRALGENPTTAVCDVEEPIGGVPASPDFDGSQEVANAINDFSCRFVNGNNERVGRGPSEACTLFSDGEFRFIGQDSTVQFCAQIPVPLTFSDGDTDVMVRLRDSSGAVGPTARIIIRVQ